MKGQLNQPLEYRLQLHRKRQENSIMASIFWEREGFLRLSVSKVEMIVLLSFESDGKLQRPLTRLVRLISDAKLRRTRAST